MSKVALPTELVVIMLSIAAASHRPTAARLCLVATWVRDLVEPELYRVLTLRHIAAAEVQQQLSSTKFRTLARSLGVVNGSFMSVPLNEVDSEEQTFSEVRNFATDSAFFDHMVSTSGVEELHLLMRRSPWEFPQLQRLHFYRRKLPTLLGDSPFPIKDIFKHPRLTHIAFSVPEEPQMSDLTRAVVQLLKEHKPLVLLFVRLLPSNSVVLRGAVEYESIEGQLASIGDPRLVVRRVNVEGHPLSLLDEWERNAMDGGSLWHWAQAQLNARRSVEPFAQS